VFLEVGKMMDFWSSLRITAMLELILLEASELKRVPVHLVFFCMLGKMW
jgi:hypothetical protein